MNPNYNFFGYYPQQQQPIKIRPTFEYVNNVEEVKNYIVMPNQVVFLKDNNGFIYEKRTDGNGYTSVDVYSLVKQQQRQYVSYEEFEALRKEVLSLKGESNDTPTNN